MPNKPRSVLCLLAAISLASSFPASAQQQPVPLDQAITQGANHPAYRNTLSQAEVQGLLDAASNSDQALRQRATTLIARDPAHGLSAYVETFGLIRADQSAMLEQMVRQQGNPASPPGTQHSTGGISTGWLLGGAAVVGVAVAAGGGGGGGGGNDAPPPSSPPPPQEPEDNSAKLLPLSAEYLFTNGYQYSFGHVAHERGFTGSGELIALIDSGVRSTHNEFDGQIAGHYNVFTDSTLEAEAQDSSGHGSHVGGILVARRNDNGSVGYAYGAQLLNVRFTDDLDNITATDQQLANGFAWARNNGARWFNNSWGIDGDLSDFNTAEIQAAFPQLLAEWQQGVATQNVYVWSTGNEGAAQPQIFAALPALYPELQEHWVAVANLDPQTGLLRASSNRCGSSAQWCLTAPGSLITSVGNSADDSYATFSGTSMAAPAVTGGLAVLAEAFPTLDSQQLVTRLLFTADKTGVYANQSIYGQGVMDLERATRPLGALTLVSSEGTILPVERSALALGEPFGSGNPLSDLRVLAADQQGAGFGIDLGAAVIAQRFRHDSTEAFQRLGQSVQQTHEGNINLSWIANADGGSQSRVLHMQQNNGHSLHLGQLQSLDGLDPKLRWVGVSQSDIRVSAPFWVQQRDESALALRQQLNLGAASLVMTSSASQWRQGLSLGLGGSDAYAYRPMLEIGYLQGRDSLFNSQSNGLYDLGKNSQTLFTGLSGNYSGKRLGLSHAAYLGQSRVDGAGLFENMGPVLTSSWLLAARWQQNDQDWGLALQQPLRVESARSRVNLATGYMGNRFDLQPISLNLAPDGRQVQLETFWQLRLAGQSTLKLSWLGIRQPGHQAKAGPMQVVMGQWQQPF